MLGLLFVFALLARLPGISSLPDDFVAPREYHTALLARALYVTDDPSSPEWMRNAAAGQLEAFIRFVVADQRLLLAGRRRDWGTFASIYNGPGYRKFRYDERMEEAYRRNAV